MITAKEAKNLVVASAANVDKYIALIEPMIVSQANEGKRSYVCYIDGLWEAMDTYAWAHSKMTHIQVSVSTKLKAFGYMVTLSRDGEEYIPRGLTDDYGEGPKHINVCLRISW